MCALAGTASAQEALYGAQAPKGSAYIRFVNAVGAPVEAHPDFLPVQRLGIAPAERVGAYFVVERVAGRTLAVDIRSGGLSGHAELHAEPKAVLTIVLEQTASGGLAAQQIIDLAEFNQNRARLSFYNAAANCNAASLALDPGGQAVFKDVASGSAGARGVNPVNALVRAGCTDQAAPFAAPAPVALAGMEAGSMFSVWLMTPGGQPTAFVTRDITTPYRP